MAHPIRCLIIAMGFIEANRQAELRGETPPYTEENFMILADEVT